MVDQENHNKTVSDYKKDYYFYTGEASKISRSLTLGGIAVIWIFKISVNETFSIPHQLILPLLLLVLSLAIDLLQYIIGGLIWYVFFIFKEKQVKKGKITDTENIEAPLILPIIIHVFYWSKIVLIFFAYYFLSSFLCLKFLKYTVK